MSFVPEENLPEARKEFEDVIAKNIADMISLTAQHVTAEKDRRYKPIVEGYKALEEKTTELLNQKTSSNVFTLITTAVLSIGVVAMALN